MIPELLPTALAFYRAPGQYAQLRDARVPLPAGVTELLAAHAHALAPEQIDDTAARLDSSPEECRAAVTFFIKQALLEARGDYYRILGVARDADSALIRQHYHYLIRLFHPDRDLDSEGWETLYAPTINEAWNQLRTPAKRSQYDASLPQPDAFDAVLAQGRDAGSSTAAVARPAENRPAAGPWTGILAGLSPRIVLSLVFGLPLLLVLLWLLAKPAPQDLRISAHELALIAPQTAATDPGPAPAVAAEPPAAPPPAGQGEGASEGAAPVSDAATRTAPRRATSAELEQQVRERLASATSAVLGPRAATGTASESAAPAPAAALQSTEPALAPEQAADAAPEFESTALAQLESNRDAGPELGREATAPPPAPAAASQLAADSRLPALDGAQLGAVVAAFARSYEAGDAQNFSALFAENADTSDAQGRDEIRDLYQGFFARPETREIRFGRMLWEYYSPFRSRGTGPIQVTTMPLDGGKPASGELMITLEVEQTAAGPAIVALYYQ